ncbi:MAG: hypothetical protein ACKOT0_01385 [bacterium]
MLRRRAGIATASLAATLLMAVPSHAALSHAAPSHAAPSGAAPSEAAVSRVVPPQPYVPIAPETVAPQQYFGHDVAVSAADFGVYGVISAPQATVGGVRSGAVRMYALARGAARPSFELLPPAAQAGASFGASVAATESLDVVVVGSPLFDVDAGGAARVDQGLAYAYVGDDAAAVLEPSDGNGGEWFGYSVDVSADGSVIAVGAPLDAVTGRGNSGAVHVFVEQAEGAWTHDARLVPLSAGEGDLVGWSVAVSPDGSAIAVGSPSADVGGANSGSVTLFTRQGAPAADPVWVEQDSATVFSAGARLGWSVDMSDDRVLSGAVGKAVGGLGGVGEARLYGLREQGDLVDRDAMTPPSPEGGEGFGQSVSLSSDGQTAAIGAPGTAGAASPAAGAVYAYTLPVSLDEVVDVAPSSTLALPAVPYRADLGSSVAVAPDGGAVLAGAPWASTDGVAQSGAAAFFSAPMPRPTAPPGITGTPRAGGTLTARPGTWPGAQVVRVQWVQCTSPGGPTGALFELESRAGCAREIAGGAEIPAPRDAQLPYVRLVVTAVSSSGMSYWSSAAVRVGARDATAPVSVSPPSVSGRKRVGARLSARDGTWPGRGIARTYSWWRCPSGFTALIRPDSTCRAIDGATGRRYRTTAADAGGNIAVQVTARNADGQLTQVSSTRRIARN